MQDTVMVIVKRKDAAFIAAAIELFQKERGIKKYEIRYGLNGLRMEFEDISKHKVKASTL